MPLTLEEIAVVVALLLADLNKRLASQTGAKEWVAENGYDPVFGARPLKRFLQRNLETKLARALIAWEVSEGPDITFTVQNNDLAQIEGVPAPRK